jgi:hypothetical protein
MNWLALNFIKVQVDLLLVLVALMEQQVQY